MKALRIWYIGCASVFQTGEESPILSIRSVVFLFSCSLTAEQTTVNRRDICSNQIGRAMVLWYMGITVACHASKSSPSLDKTACREGTVSLRLL